MEHGYQDVQQRESLADVQEQDWPLLVRDSGSGAGAASNIPSEVEEAPGIAGRLRGGELRSIDSVVRWPLMKR